MQAHEKGVLTDSPIYFHTPSEFAKATYFYPICTGRYHCTKQYHIKRQNYDSYMFLYVLRGSGYLYVNHEKTSIAAGTLALIDCYQPHCYGTDEEWDILWLHFDGPVAANFISAINNIPLPLSRNMDTIVRYMEKLFAAFHNKAQIEEALLNQYLVNILTELLVSPEPSQPTISSSMEKVRLYISEHPDKDLPLTTLAQMANLSPYYFNRIFKKEIGYTPHEYLIQVRMNTARFYLKTSDLPVKEIASRVGFTNESTFCSAFKKENGCTPNAYRFEQSSNK